MALDAVDGETICPDCKSDLKHSTEPITCKVCGKDYPLWKELSPDAH